MPNTFTLISSSTLASPQASFNFTSIPNTYTDLCIKLSGRSSTGYNAADFYLTLNGTSSGYSGRYVMKDSNDANASTSTSVTTKLLLGFVPATQATTNAFGTMEAYIPNYGDSNYKSVYVESATENNGVIQWIYFASGLWSNTAVINQVTLTDATGTFATNSTAYLYGIKKS